MCELAVRTAHMHGRGEDHHLLVDDLWDPAGWPMELPRPKIPFPLIDGYGLQAGSGSAREGESNTEVNLSLLGSVHVGRDEHAVLQDYNQGATWEPLERLLVLEDYVSPPLPWRESEGKMANGWQ